MAARKYRRDAGCLRLSFCQTNAYQKQRKGMKDKVSSWRKIKNIWT